MMNRRVLSDVLSGVLGSIVLGMLLIFVSNLPFTVMPYTLRVITYA